MSSNGFLPSYEELVQSLDPAAKASPGAPARRVLLCGGYTTKYLDAAIRALAARNGIHLAIEHLPYGIFQTALRGDLKEFVEAKPDIIYFCTGWPHFDLEMPEQSAEDFLAAIGRLQKQVGAQVVVSNLVQPPIPIYGNLEKRLDSSLTAKVDRFNRRLLAGSPEVCIYDCARIADEVGLRHWYNEREYLLTKNPCAMDLLPCLADGFVRIVSGLIGVNHRAFIVDLDNTLWGGVVGDDGPENLQVGLENPISEGFRDFQIYLKKMKDRGIILAISSKNNPEIVKRAFEIRKDMPLKLDDFGAVACDWTAKDTQVRQICKQLNLSSASCVFVDDNPAERALIRMSLPEVAVVELPQEPASFARAVNFSARTTPIAIHQEDQLRNDTYRTNAMREQLAASTLDKTEFLRSLRMTISCAPIGESNRPRAWELLSKTNQFNFTGYRPSLSELTQAMEGEGMGSMTAKLRDRFGELGLIAVLLHQRRGDALELKNWVMSCRAFDRHVEHFLLGKLIALAKAQGLHQIDLRFTDTDKNQYARKFVEGHFAHVKKELWRLKLEDVALISRIEKESEGIFAEDHDS